MSGDQMFMFCVSCCAVGRMDTESAESRAVNKHGESVNYEAPFNLGLVLTLCPECSENPEVHGCGCGVEHDENGMDAEGNFHVATFMDGGDIGVMGIVAALMSSIHSAIALCEERRSGGAHQIKSSIDDNLIPFVIGPRNAQ